MMMLTMRRFLPMRRDGMDAMRAAVTILGVACVIFWVVGYLSFRFQTYKR
eukprot:COSAG01_NODE_2261_length_8057_cov_38.489570_9_plen_50_part_00